MPCLCATHEKKFLFIFSSQEEGRGLRERLVVLLEQVARGQDCRQRLRYGCIHPGILPQLMPEQLSNLHQGILHQLMPTKMRAAFELKCYIFLRTVRLLPNTI